jgi:hypothetical protein
LLCIHFLSVKRMNPRPPMQLLSNQRRQSQRQRHVAAVTSSFSHRTLFLYIILHLFHVILLLLLLRPQRAPALPVSVTGNRSRLLLELLQILDSARRSRDEVSRPLRFECCAIRDDFFTLNPFSFYPPEVDPYRLRDKIVSVIPYVYGRSSPLPLPPPPPLPPRFPSTTSFFSYLGAFATSEEPKVVPEPKLNGAPQ